MTIFAMFNVVAADGSSPNKNHGSSHIAAVASAVCLVAAASIRPRRTVPVHNYGDYDDNDDDDLHGSNKRPSKRKSANPDNDDAMTTIGNDMRYKSALLQLYSQSPLFEEIVRFGLAMGRLTVADPEFGSKDLRKAKLMVGLNYFPLRTGSYQPCIEKLELIMRLILVEVLKLTKEAADEFVRDCVVYVNRCPFALDYTFVQANKAWYNALLSKTDGLMAEMLSQVFNEETCPELKAVIACGKSAFPFFSSELDFSDLTIQEDCTPHPQIFVNRQPTYRQRAAAVEDFTAALSLATGVQRSGHLTADHLDQISVVSVVLEKERRAKAGLTRRRNTIILKEMRGLIDSRTQSLGMDVKSMSINVLRIGFSRRRRRRRRRRKLRKRRKRRRRQIPPPTIMAAMRRQKRKV
jgi:hypothetical protein